jgi:hypothetical protein
VYVVVVGGGGGGVYDCSATVDEPPPPPHAVRPNTNKHITPTSTITLSNLFNMFTVSSKCVSRA